MSIQSLANSIKNVVDKRIDNEARALHGTIKTGMFISGSQSLPFKAAVDCNTSDGRRVWAQRSKDGKAVIVGA